MARSSASSTRTGRWTAKRRRHPIGRRPSKNGLGFDAHGHLYRLAGVDLTAIPGLSTSSVLTILSETGVDMSRWRSGKAFASWLGLCPDNRISGGKVLSSRSKPCASRAARVLRMAA